MMAGYPVAGHAAFAAAAVDRLQCWIDRKTTHFAGEAFVEHGNVAMINGPPPELNDVARGVEALMSVTLEVAPALVVGHDEPDIRVAALISTAAAGKNSR